MESNLNERNTTLRDYLRIIFRRKTVFITTVLITMITVFIGLQLKTPVYESKVKMIIGAKKQIESPYYKDITDFRSTEMALTQSEIVKSNPVIERAVRRLRMNEPSLQYEKQFCSPLKSILLDLKAKFQKKFVRIPGQAKDEFLLINAVQELKKRIKVEPITDTDLFTITVTDFSPTRAARIANTVSRSYCLFDLEQQLAELQQKYGEKHLFVMQLKDNIQKMEANLTGSSLSNIEAIGPASVKIIEQAAVAAESTGIPKTLIFITAFFMSFVLGITLAFGCESLDPAIKSPEELKSCLGLPFLGYLPKRNPAIFNFLSILRNTVSIFFIALCLLISSRILAGWLGLDTQNPIIQFIYRATVLPASFIKKALPSNFKTNIDNSAIILLFVIIFFYIILIKILSLLRKILIENKLLIKTNRKITPCIDAYQRVSEQVYLSAKGNGQKSIAIVSSLPSEGNTAILSNLGIYLADYTNRNVLLIDANLRKPSLGKIFKIDSNSGLTDLLTGAVPFEETVQRINPNLYIITTGKAIPEPVNLLNSAKMPDILREAEKRFEIIFIDCANLKNSKDAIALSSYVDGFILLVNEGKTRREVLKAAIAPLVQKKANFIGVILNNRTFSIPKFIYEMA